MKKTPWIAAAVAALGLPACGTTTIDIGEPNEVTVSVVGTVTDAATTLPLEGARLEVRATENGVLFAEANSDADGQYSFTFLYRYYGSQGALLCPFLFLVTKSGYFGENPELACIASVQTIDVELAPSR
jgi:hypothetical protein